MKVLNQPLRSFITLLAIVLFATVLNAQNCEVRITKPAEGSQVAGTALISGTATLPTNGHLWIFAHQVGFNGYWPQGGGPAQLTGRDWDVFVYFGQRGIYGRFEVIAMVVDDQTHRNLQDWVQRAPNTIPPYQPIPLPTMIDGCSITRLRVEKTSD
jgi:hypothetical protein